jgi:uncharacterized protein
MTRSVVNEPDARRYAIYVDGELAGFSQYRLHGDGDIIFTHTEVDPQKREEGLASELVQRALDDVRETGRRVFPQCPYMAAWLKKHPDYQDLTDARS